MRPGEFEVERYELVARPFYRFGIGRRELFKIAGLGLVVLAAAGDAQQESGGGRRGQGGGPQDVEAFIHVGEDGAVTVFTGKVEVGQNARTALTQAVAEELRVAVQAITMVMADTERTPFDAGTFGSRTTPTMNLQLRKAGAAAREVLIDLAAAEWKADRATLTAADGKVTDSAGSRSLTYGQLTHGRKIAAAVSAGAPAPATQWKVAGTSVAKVDGRDFVTGKHVYTSDVKRPGMVYGKVLRPSAFNATLALLDKQAAEAMPGVSVVRDGDFVGVVSADSHLAGKALDALKAEWTAPPQISNRELFDQLKKGSGGGGNGAPREVGSMDAGLRDADQRLTQTYTVAYIAHAPLEPRAAVAEWTDDRLTVWTGTQRPFGVRTELAQAFRMPEDHIRVITLDTGSGYGGKHKGEAAIEAARLSKAAGKPVKLVWSRQEEFTWAYFRPAGVIDIAAGVKKDGTLTAWEFHNYNSGTSGLPTPYDVANQRVGFHPAQSPLQQGSYRGLAATANHFARETHMDALAHAVGMDPLAFRLKNLTEPRLRAVLEAAAEKFGWGKSPSTPERAYGIACGTEKGGYVATCVEMASDRRAGSLRLTRLVSAFECGAVVNPEQLKNQVEGAAIMGIGGALFEAIEFENGKILNPRFSKYRVPRFLDTPTVEAVLLDRKDIASAGAGETPIVSVAPAIGSALFAATGQRLNGMPMLPLMAKRG